MKKRIISFIIITLGLCLYPYSALCDFPITIGSSVPQRHAELPFVYPFNNKFDSKDDWKMSNTNNYGTNFGHINHAVPGSHHTGEDWLVNASSTQTQEKPIYSINNGVVVYSGLHKSSTGYLVIIRHDAKPGMFFELPIFQGTYSYGGNTYSYSREARQCSTIYSYYLHLSKDSRITQGTPVEKGTVIGKTYSNIEKANYSYTYVPHLHFEIYSDSKVTGNIFKDNEGYALPGKDTETTFGYQLYSKGLVEPLDFIDANNAQKRRSGNVAWWPADKTCEEASKWYDLSNPTSPQTKAICSQLYQTVQTISQSPNPSKEVPEEHFWQSWLRSLIDFFGLSVSADEIMNYTIIQEISIPIDNPSAPATIISGSGSSPTDGTGFGYGINPTEAPVYALPDFITTEVRLKTPDGIEKYEYEITDEIKIHAWFQNIGDADWAGTHDDMEVRFYLSKGYKEDSHSEWIRVGSETIQKYNIELGDPPKHEEEGLILSNYPVIEPGKVYNIVACADRIADKDNADGDVPEMHKSNNCSTEAVFWVKAKPEGYLNQATCDMIQGWARDPDTANPISVHFYADGPAGTGTYIGSADADTYREDLPYSDKNHGFSFKTPDSLKNNQAHSIYVYAIDSQGGQNPLLNNSPQNIQCQLVPVEAIMAIINTILLSDDPFLPGDLNGDTFVTLADAILALKVVSYTGNQSVQIESDVNNDKKIGLIDAVYILQKVSKVR